MSMSQEEIESLMNGLDFKDDDSSSESDEKKAEPQGNMSEDDINELIAQTEDIVKNEDKKVEDESVEDILNNLENIEKEEDKPSEETNIDDIIKELENSQNEEKSSENQEKEELKEEKPSENTEEQNESLEEAKDEPTIEETIAQSNEKLSSDNIDEILSSIEGIEEEKVPEPSIDYEEKRGDDLDSKIDSGVFPLPVEEDTKVVNQLSAVANDSEEKATKIFDVLSNILDYNNAIQNDVKILNDFSEKQVAMLSSLSQKFPNIEVFKKNLEAAKEMSTHISDVNEKINDGNAEIFQAMELMQFHDINRQK
ncbi:hypothetical protein [Halarcobacter anaerophilus]|uniref:hypothetical protein n=1 Tax=Halarcobacter anaerophilus TaxID=877500 RepID=UPI00069775CB|nr:hypothetical protein [Halarcobacter anaerophilus]